LDNAKILVSKGAALELIPTSAGSVFYKPGAEEIKKEVFSSEDVYSKFKRVLTEESFLKNMSKLRTLSNLTGGVETACIAVEQVYLTGGDKNKTMK
jgi:hypothetical protein